MTCFFFHKWGKWFELVVNTEILLANGTKIPGKRDMQKRVCEKCGKVEIVGIGL